MQKLIATMDGRKAAMLQDAAAWGPEALLFRPAPTTWCALDVIDHLSKVESEIALSVQANAATPRAVPPRDKVMAIVVYSAMYAPTRIKAPAGAATTLPRTPASLEEASGTWSAARQLVTETITALEEKQVRGGVFQHPVSGWMSAAGTLRFLDAHLAHHAFQWKRLRALALKQA